MTKTTGSILAMTALLLVACEQGNKAPGALPPVGSYTSNVPGPGYAPCANGIGNCAIVPDPYGVTSKKDSPAKIAFPDYTSESPEIQAPIGNSYSVLVSTTNVTGLGLTCSATAVVSLSPNSEAGDYLLYLGSMPDKDMECLLTGQGPKEKISAKLIFHPAAVGYVEMLEVRNLLTAVPLKIGESYTFKNFYIKGYDKTTTVKVACTSGQSPVLETVKDKNGWYNMTVSGPKTPETTETCTVSAQRDSDGQKAAASVALTTPPKSKAAVITAGNFDPLARLHIVEKLVRIGVKAEAPAPQIWVQNVEDDSPTITLSCTSNDASVFSPTYSISAVQKCVLDPKYLQCVDGCTNAIDPLCNDKCNNVYSNCVVANKPPVPKCISVVQNICKNDADYTKCLSSCNFEEYTEAQYVCLNSCQSNYYDTCYSAELIKNNCPAYMLEESNILPTDLSGLAKGTKAYNLSIHYSKTGADGTANTCTVTATNEDGVTSSLTIKVVYKDAPYNQVATPIDKSRFEITPYDGVKDRVLTTCSADTSATVTSTKNTQKLNEFVINTVAPSAVGGVNICNVMVVHEGIQTAYTKFTVTAKQP